MMRIEICIPALNEADIIATTVRELKAACARRTDVAWLFSVVDNGSTDGTADAVRNLHDSDVRVIELSERGKGRAVVHAARASTADYFGYVDADQSANPEHVPELFAALEAGADVAVGSRRLNPKTTDRSVWRSATSAVFHWYAEALVPTGVTDSQCGMKLMNRRACAVLATCEDQTWFFDREFLGKCRQRDMRIVELPVQWKEFRFPNRKSRLRVMRDGIRAVFTLPNIRRRINAERL